MTRGAPCAATPGLEEAAGGSETTPSVTLDSGYRNTASETTLFRKESSVKTLHHTKQVILSIVSYYFKVIQIILLIGDKDK